MASPLSNLVNNHAEGFIELNVNMEMIIKNVKHAELITKIVIAFLNPKTLEIN